jgi:hypothetical protein
MASLLIRFVPIADIAQARTISLRAAPQAGAVKLPGLFTVPRHSGARSLVALDRPLSVQLAVGWTGRHILAWDGSAFSGSHRYAYLSVSLPKNALPRSSVPRQFRSMGQRSPIAPNALVLWTVHRQRELLRH